MADVIASVARQSIAPQMQTRGIAASATPPRNDGIDKVAREFEGMFMGQMLKLMFESVKTDPVFGGGTGEDIFRSMLLDEYGKKMVESKGLGIADAIRGQLLKLQEAQ